MRRSSEHSSSFSIFRIFVFIAVFCFLFGFLVEVILLGFHHGDHDIPSPALRARIVEKAVVPPSETFVDTSKLASDVSIPSKQTLNIVNVPVIEDELKTKYGSGGEEDVPSIVKAWRLAKLDWHQLLPKHNSIWERFGTPQGEGKFPILVAKEQQATDFLTRFRESGLAGKYGREHGPLLDYSSCNIFSDVCTIHQENECKANEFCHWDLSTKLCTEGPRPKEEQESCPSPVTLRGNQFVSTNPGECTSFIHKPTVLMDIDSESQTMFYHWWATWASIRDHWLGNLQSSKDIHVLIGEITDPMFFTYFGFISKHCWRRADRQIPKRTCLCNAHKFGASQSRARTVHSVELMLDALGLKAIQPPPNRVRVGLISRRKKRFILNEYELVDAVVAMGYDCVLLPLEAMTIYEQTRELRSLDVLVGIHGSALDNSVFLHPGSVLVQLLPYKVEHRVTFQSSAVEAGMVYMEWQLKDKNKAFFHWDLMEQANAEKLHAISKDQILAAGQEGTDNRETVMFWINQDIIVPLDEWRTLIQDAVRQSPARTRGFDISPKN